MVTSTKTEYECIIVGSGFSGIAAACRIQMDLGLSNFAIFEKDTQWGGTWANSGNFPGAGCDIPVSDAFGIECVCVCVWMVIFNAPFLLPF